MPTTYVKPREGGRVRMPERDSTVMPSHGAWIEVTDYYQRLLLADDIALADPPKAQETGAPPQPGPSSWTVTSAHDGAVYDVTVSYEVSPDPAAQGTTVTPGPLTVALTQH